MDIIRDFVERLLERHNAAQTFTEAMAMELEQAIRSDWGGERVYIAKLGEKVTREERNAALLRDWHQGERVPLLARRYRLSARRVRQIVKEA